MDAKELAAILAKDMGFTVSEQEIYDSLEFPEPLNNAIFLATLGVKGRSDNMLRSLINAVLTHSNSKPISNIEDIMTEHMEQGINIRAYRGRIDLFCLASDALIDLEAQNRVDNAFTNRCLLSYVRFDYAFIGKRRKAR